MATLGSASSGTSDSSGRWPRCARASFSSTTGSGRTATSAATRRESHANCSSLTSTLSGSSVARSMLSGACAYRLCRRASTSFDAAAERGALSLWSAMKPTRSSLTPLAT
jgi:hypothetical protein